MCVKVLKIPGFFVVVTKQHCPSFTSHTVNKKGETQTVFRKYLGDLGYVQTTFRHFHPKGTEHKNLKIIVAPRHTKTYNAN